GKQGVLDAVVKENDEIVDRTLANLGLSRSDSAETVYAALIKRLIQLDTDLNDLLDKPDLSQMSVKCGKLCEVAFKVFTPPRGLFIKREKVVSLLEKFKPDSLLQHFGYQTVAELVEKEGFSSVVAALRFTQTKEWMHKFFDEAYIDLKPEDFEERDVELKVLDAKWLTVAEQFLEKKYHNVSHLKEYGIIFVIPLTIDTPGEVLRLFTLILHYLHEVPFYSGLFRKFIGQPDFTRKLNSLLRGDVPESPAPESPHMTWRIVQRYLAKDDENDFRLKEQHVNPEADHWLRAERDLGKLEEIMGKTGLSFWTGLDFVGDFFKDHNGQEQLISFDLIDLIMSLVKKGEIKYLYHQQEALWDKIFSEYMGREKMESLVDEHIIGGFIQL
ncbi:MAG: hypothetical protein KW806_00890, partial [Candidatus Yanofskybacteria bacterium]|nr:hypothetical protein [Candidatus Yanofskybacteria bacterium]